jgi:hypothetical protein
MKLPMGSQGKEVFTSLSVSLKNDRRNSKGWIDNQHTEVE